MESLKNELLKNRPNLSSGSILTYSSVLRSLYFKLIGNKSMDHLGIFHQTAQVLESLKDEKINKKKTTLAALFVLTGIQEYREDMLDTCKDYQKHIDSQEKTPSQVANWVTKEDVKNKLKELKIIATPLLKKAQKTELSAAELQLVQNYIILVLTGGLFFAPRRSLDWTELKVSDIELINQDKDNFIETIGKKQWFIFNTYKTAKTYSQQRVEIPATVKTILKKWMTVIPPTCHYLLFDNHSNKLSSVTLNQRLNAIFGKKVGTSLLRHTYLSEKYGSTIDTKKKLEKDMKAMGSSINISSTYILK